MSEKAKQSSRRVLMGLLVVVLTVLVLHLGESLAQRKPVKDITLDSGKMQYNTMKSLESLDKKMDKLITLLQSGKLKVIASVPELAGKPAPKK